MDEKLKVQFGKHPKLYWIAIGKTDFLYKNNVDYRKKLDDNGYKYEYYESDGGHIWKNWRIYLTKFAPNVIQIAKYPVVETRHVPRLYDPSYSHIITTYS